MYYDNNFKFVGEVPKKINEEVLKAINLAIKEFKINISDLDELVSQINNIVDDILERKSYSKKFRNIHEVAFSLGCCYGYAISEKYGWNWKMVGQSYQDCIFSLISPDNNYCIMPVDYIFKILQNKNINSYGENGNNILLFFNRLVDISKNKKINLIENIDFDYLTSLLKKIDRSYLKNIDDICKRTIACLFSIQQAFGIIYENNDIEGRMLFLKLLEGYGVLDFLLPSEKALFDNKFSEKDVDAVLSSYEIYWSLLWVLGILDNKEAINTCDWAKANDIVGSCKNYDEFKNKCHLRSIEKIFDMLNVYVNFINKKANLKDSNNTLTPDIAIKRAIGLMWVINKENDWNELILKIDNEIEEIENASIKLIDWLLFPTELGQEPSEIEYTNQFIDDNKIKCMIFKYKKAPNSEWLLGIVSDLGTFSEMKKYNEKTEIIDSENIVKSLQEYWEVRLNEKISDNKTNYYEGEQETIIDNEYDYSNIIPTFEYIGYIVQYCEDTYNYLRKLVEEDKKKNEKLKYEFQNFNYHEFYGLDFSVMIRNESFKTITYKNYNSYIESVNSGKVKNVESLEIELNLGYKRGDANNLKVHENSFKIIFKPYNIKFIRKSNYNEAQMNQVENNINEILKRFQTANSIFYSK